MMMMTKPIRFLSPLCFFLAVVLSPVAAPSFAGAQDKKYGAFGSTILHRDGSRTERQKMGDSNQIREVTYNKDSVCIQSRLFIVDNQGNLRNGVLWDGRGNRLGSTSYIYHQTTGQLLEERLFNNKGQIVRRLFYPGALNDPRYANRMVAFTYDPNVAPEKQKPRETTQNVKPIAPVTEAQDEFDPSLPTGDSGSTSLQSPSESAPAKKEKRTERSFLFRKKSST